MPIENKYYDSEWESVHDYHRDQSNRLFKELSIFSKSDGKNPLPINQAEVYKEAKYHHEICLHILSWVQHKTVQDYAEWQLKNFSDGLDISNLPSFEDFKSIEEAMAFWNDLREKRRFQLEEEWDKLEKKDLPKIERVATEHVDDERQLVRGEPLIKDKEHLLHKLLNKLTAA